MQARTWLNSLDPDTLWWNITRAQAKEKFPHIAFSNLSGLGESHNLIVESIIDLEEEWGFSRDDWFTINRILYVSNDDILAMFKLVQT